MSDFNAWLITALALCACTIITKEPGLLFLVLAAFINTILNIGN